MRFINFSEAVQLGIENLFGTDSLLRNWIAASQSCYSDPVDSRFWLPDVHTSKQALMALFLSCYRPYWETMEIHQRIGELAYQNRYSGQWQEVQWVIEHQDPTFVDDKIWLSLFDPCEFYGNFLRDCEQFLRKRVNRKLRKYEQLGRVKTKVRRRGYQDKGSLRPSHKKGRLLADPQPGEDRRRRNNHPLLREEFPNDEAQEGVRSETTSLDSILKEVTFEWNQIKQTNATLTVASRPRH